MSNSLEAKIAKLEAALAELQDERAIRTLISRYAIHTDAGRVSEWLNLWTDDGVEEIDFQGRLLRWAGKQEMTAWRQGAAEQRRDQPNNRMHFQSANVVVHLSGNEATASSYAFALGLDGGKAVVTSYGAVRWALRKRDGRWLIKARMVREMNSAELRQALAATPQ